jgi:hypothetical protein
LPEALARAGELGGRVLLANGIERRVGAGPEQVNDSLEGLFGRVGGDEYLALVKGVGEDYALDAGNDVACGD